MMGFVFGLSLQGLLATSGIIAIVLGLALQSTLGDVFSGISLSIEKPYRIGDEIVLEAGAEGKVIQVNWRSTHLKNGANDVVVVPNSSIAKLRIQNHSAGTKCYSGSLTVTVDSRNEPELTLSTRSISSEMTESYSSIGAEGFSAGRVGSTHMLAAKGK
jgi:small-conductance mechanosensitive channel